MDCVNHNGVNATAYCQNCGKGLCADCIAAGAMRTMPGGQILCDICIRAWQSVQPPLAAMHPHGPNPSAAAVLGLIPGVGAMYNGQFIKGLIHVVVFAVLIALAHPIHFVGILIPAWILYQSFEAYHTARAMRDGQPLPDPFGFNEFGNWLNPTGAGRVRYPEPATASDVTANAAPAGQASQGASQSPYPGQYQAPYPPPPTPPPVAGFADPAMPPGPPIHWHRREPVGAIVLIALGMLFLLGQLDIFQGRLFEFAWPLALIAIGVWLIVRRLGDSQGDSK